MTWLPVSEIAKYEGVPSNTILQRCYRNKDTVSQLSEKNSKGRGGKVRLININSPAISDAAREKYLFSHSTPCQNLLEPMPTALSYRGQGEQPLPVHTSSPDMVPEKFKAIALARFDLLAAWEQHRQIYGRSKGLLRADETFEQSYNTGLLLPAAYKVLGKIDIRTIKRWQQKVNDTKDWLCLVPEWACERKEPALSDEEKRTFQDCLLQPNRLNIGEATKITKVVLAKRGIDSPSSPRKFRRWAEWYKGKNSHIWTLMREGQKALNDKEIFSIKRDVTKLEVGDVFVADGHRLNFQVINPFTGKPCRATLVGYLDWKSWDLAGFDIMLEENTQSISTALRQSILNLGRIPKIAFQDNGKAFRAKFFTESVDFEEAGFNGLFGRLGIQAVFAMKYNAKAKPVERFFKEFAKFERLLPSFTGTSIDDKPAYMKMGETFHKVYHNNYIPTIEETASMVNTWIREYLEVQPCPHVKGKTIGEVFREGQGPGVNIDELDDLMMAQEIKTIHQNGIRFLGADYYDDAFYGLREKAIVKYSLSDLSYIRVYDRDGKFLATAKRVMPVHPMAQYFGDAKDVTEVKHLQNKKKKLEKITMDAARELIAQGRETPPWLDIVPMTPRAIERLEETAASFRQGKERSLLEDLSAQDLPRLAADAEEHGVTEISQEAPATTEDIPLTRPQFDSPIKRYQWHLKHGCPTEEDERWVAQFKTSMAYESYFQFFDEQEEEYQNREALQHHAQAQRAD